MNKLIIVIVFSFIIIAQSNVYAVEKRNAEKWVISWVDIRWNVGWVEITLNNDQGENDRYWFSTDLTANPYYKEMLAVCLSVYQSQSLVTCYGDDGDKKMGDFFSLKRITLEP